MEENAEGKHGKGEEWRRKEGGREKKGGWV